MKRRLNIACAIAHDPQIIIMDEPTVGITTIQKPHIGVYLEAKGTWSFYIILHSLYGRSRAYC